LSELYYEDYNKYEEIKKLNSLKTSNDVLKNVDPNFGISLLKENQIKYNGKLDIIIPYYLLTDD
jgi:hypothetical protein